MPVAATSIAQRESPASAQSALQLSARMAIAITPCPLGQLGVALSPSGIAAIRLADEASQLLASFMQDYPDQHALPQDDPRWQVVTDVLAVLAHPEQPFNHPLDLSGSDFQRRVWSALQRIPVGTTLSYSQLAAAIGQPTAVRAVASACAANRIAIIIPCHRVRRHNGDLGGYRWGSQRKQQLLQGETACAAPSHTGS